MKKIIILLFLLAIAINYQTFLNGMDQPNNASDEIGDYKLFKAIQKIQDIIEESIEKNRIDAISGREAWEINPVVRQTKKGLLLNIIVKDSMPTNLSTPWGVVSLIGIFYPHTLFKPVTEELLRRLKIELLKDGANEWGVHLQTYKVLAVDDVELPVPQEQKHVEKYRESEKVKSAWKQLEERYKREKLSSHS